MKTKLLILGLLASCLAWADAATLTIEGYVDYDMWATFAYLEGRDGVVDVCAGFFAVPCNANTVSGVSTYWFHSNIPGTHYGYPVIDTSWTAEDYMGLRQPGGTLSYEVGIFKFGVDMDGNDQFALGFRSFAQDLGYPEMASIDVTGYLDWGWQVDQEATAIFEVTPLQTPVPEPSAVILFAAPALLLAGVHRRKRGC